MEGTTDDETLKGRLELDTELCAENEGLVGLFEDVEECGKADELRVMFEEGFELDWD